MLPMLMTDHIGTLFFQPRELCKGNSTLSKGANQHPTLRRPSRVQLELARDPPASSACKASMLNFLTPARMAGKEVKSRNVVFSTDQSSSLLFQQPSHEGRCRRHAPHRPLCQVPGLHGDPVRRLGRERSARQRRLPITCDQIHRHWMMDEFSLIQCQHRILLAYDTSVLLTLLSL